MNLAYIPFVRREGFLSGSVVENLPTNAGDVGSISGSGRFPGVGNGNPLQYSRMENSWWATVHGVVQSQT